MDGRPHSLRESCYNKEIENAITAAFPPSPKRLAVMKESKNTMRLLKHPARLITRTRQSRWHRPRQRRWRLDNSRLREVQLRWSLCHLRFLRDVKL